MIQRCGGAVSYLVRVGLLFAFYFATAKFGLRMGAVSGIATAVWPPAGISLVALSVFGYRLWPGITLAAFLVNLSIGAPALSAAGMAAGNTLEALTGVYLLRRVAGFRDSLDRLRDVVGLVVLAAGLSTLITATIGVASGWLGGAISSANYGKAWWTWWAGDMMGDLVLAPLLFVWISRPRVSLPSRSAAEAAALMVCVIAASLLVFEDRFAARFVNSPYIVFPFVIWAALRFAQPGVVTATFATSAIAVWGTAHGLGPFAQATLTDSLLRLQTFMGVVAVTMLLLAANVTERKQAVEALHASERRFRALVERSWDSTSLIAPDGTILYDIPKTSIWTLGYAPGELVGQNAFDWIHPDDRQGVMALFGQLLQQPGASLTSEFRCLHKDGTWRWVESIGTNLLSEPSVQAIVANYRDITERKRAEKALQESEERYRSIVETANEGIWCIDDNLRTEYANQRMAQMLGYSVEELLERPTYDFLLPSERPGVTEAIEPPPPGITPPYARRYLRKDGSDLCVLCSTGPIRDATGDLIGVLGMFTDITERMQAEEALQETNQTLQALIEASPLAIIALDSHNNVQTWSPAAERIFGWTEPEVLGRPAPIVPEERRDEYPTILQLTREGQAITGYETQRRHKDGSLIDVGVWAAPLGSDTHGDSGIVAVVADITARKRAEDEIKRHHRQLGALHAITVAVSSSLELPQVLTTTKRLVVEELGVPGGIIFLHDESTGQLSLLDGWGVPDAILQDLSRLPLTGPLHEEVMRQQAAILTPDFREVATFIDVGLDVAQPDWQSYLCVPLLIHGQLAGVVGLFSETPAVFTEDEVIFFQALLEEVGVAIQNARLFEEVRDARERLQSLSLRLVELQETERQYIARELHDEVGQLLTGLKLALEMSERLPFDPARKSFNEAQGLVNELIARVRELSLTLRPPMLDDMGLLPALLWHIDRYGAQTGVQVTVAQRGCERRFPRAVETAVYRIVQEALTNVARHAGVREATVRLWVQQGALGVQIEDQGSGFDAAAELSADTSRGLLGMYERAKLLGGQIEVESAPGAGSRLTALLPLGEPTSGGEERESSHSAP